LRFYQKSLEVEPHLAVGYNNMAAIFLGIIQSVFIKPVGIIKDPVKIRLKAIKITMKKKARARGISQLETRVEELEAIIQDILSYIGLK